MKPLYSDVPSLQEQLRAESRRQRGDGKHGGDVMSKAADVLDEVVAALERWREGEYVTDEECERLGAKVDQLADERFEEALAAILYCRGGHKPVDDACGKPECRYCMNCRKSMPGEKVAR